MGMAVDVTPESMLHRRACTIENNASGGCLSPEEILAATPKRETKIRTRVALRRSRALASRGVHQTYVYPREAMFRTFASVYDHGSITASAPVRGGFWWLPAGLLYQTHQSRSRLAW
jgi:hypothetical protein